jgi:hypothetical protein
VSTIHHETMDHIANNKATLKQMEEETLNLPLEGFHL